MQSETKCSPRNFSDRKKNDDIFSHNYGSYFPVIISTYYLLQDMVAELKEYNEAKWSDLTVSDLFQEMLRDAYILMS